MNLYLYRQRQDEGAAEGARSRLVISEIGRLMAAPRGLSTPRALKVTINKIGKTNGREIQVFLRIYTIFCVREAVTISYHSRILLSPLGH